MIFLAASHVPASVSRSNPLPRLHYETTYMTTSGVKEIGEHYVEF